MVLLQVVIDGSVDTKATTYCSLYGKYKVKLLSYDIRFTANPNALIKLKSSNLIGNFSSITGMYRNYIVVGSNSQNVGSLCTSTFEYVVDNINGVVDLEILDWTDLSPVGLTYAIFNFDFEKID